MSFRISHPETGGQAVVPEHTLATYAARGWVIEGQVDDRVAAASPALKMPVKSASAAEWRTYAVAVGDMTVAEAFDKTRDELADHYRPAAKPEPAKAPAKPRSRKARRPAPKPSADPAAAPVTDTETAPATTAPAVTTTQES